MLKSKQIALFTSFVAMVFVFTVTPVVMAQTVGNRLTMLNRMGEGPPIRANQIRQQLDSTSPLSSLLVLEGAVDERTYVLGPGDQLSLVIGGATPVELIVPVSADGYLILAEAGMIRAADRLLADVRQEALASLQTYYRNVPVMLNLLAPRAFYIHLSGAVPEPGRYLVMPLGRLDDAIQLAFAARAVAQPDPSDNGALKIAGSAASERPALQNTYRPSLRNVEIQHRDGTTDSIDLLRYYVEGDMAHNPYLRDGDMVRLPSYDRERETIRITGDIASDTRIEFRAGDTVLDILRLAAGDLDGGTFDEVRLTRRLPDGSAETRPVDVPGMLTGTATPVALQPGDHVNVVPHEIEQAAIYGFVQYPGTYPIRNGETTLRELLGTAGGLKPEASVRAAYIERRQSQTFKGTGQASDLDFFGRAYLQQSLRENKLSISLVDALSPDAPEVVLYSGDVVVFPRDEQTVYLTGNVVQPGYLPFVEGKTARYYIEQAGGKAPLSRGVYVLVAGTGEVLEDEGAIVRAGDTIFVNRDPISDNPEIQSLILTDQVSRRQTGIARTQTVITGITALVSVINTYLLIRDRLNN
ncbi:MAG: SLBB domain-containing protein [Rhodothermales bacterium]